MSDNQSSRSSSSANIVNDDGYDAVDVLIAEFDSSQSSSSTGKVSKGEYDAVDAFCAEFDSSRSSSSADIVYDDGYDAVDVLLAEFGSSQSSSSSGKVTKGGYDAVDALCAELDISQRSSSPDIDSNDGCEAADALCDELSITSSDDERFESPTRRPRAQTPESHPFLDDALSSPRRSTPAQRRKARLSPPRPSTPCKNENEARARLGLPPVEDHDEVPRAGHGGEIDKQRWGTDSADGNRSAKKRLAEQIVDPVRRWAESVASSWEEGTLEVFSPERAQDVTTYEVQWHQFTPVKKRRRSPLSPSQSDNCGVGASSSNLSSSPEHNKRIKRNCDLVSHKENGSA